MDVWVARQPILDRKKLTFGYELLFRSRQDSDHFDATAGAAATTRLIADTVLGIGLDNLLGGRKAFVNFDRSLLLGGVCSILPRSEIVIEVLETVDVDPEVLAALQDLRRKGYAIALDDFVSCPETEPLTHFAGIIKVDIQATPVEEQKRMLEAYQPRGIRMLAEKVETREEFAWALAAGYDYFQGYFFARPAIVPGTQVSPVEAVCLNLLRETEKAQIDFGRVGTLIAGDVALSWQLLCYVNSALFYRRVQIESVHQALTLLGENRVRHWSALAAIFRLAGDKSRELLVLSLVRAHFGEYLMKLAHASQARDAWLMGLFSLLDALLDVPLEDALRRADVSSAVHGALLGTVPDTDPLRAVYCLVRAWESADWAAVSRLAAQTGIPVEVIGTAYAESTFWSEKALRGNARRSYSRRHLRQASSGTFELRRAGGGGDEKPLQARLIDISASGLRLQVAETIPLATSVLCDLPEMGISGLGFVRHCNLLRGEYSIGLECVDSVGWRMVAGRSN